MRFSEDFEDCPAPEEHPDYESYVGAEELRLEELQMRRFVRIPLDGTLPVEVVYGIPSSLW